MSPSGWGFYFNLNRLIVSASRVATLNLRINRINGCHYRGLTSWLGGLSPTTNGRSSR